MTFSVSDSPYDGHVRIGVTHGPVSFTVDEHPDHLRYFWGQLGTKLDHPKPGGKSHGQHAYEAYHDHVGGRSVHGEELPAWDHQEPHIREAWETAASAVRSASGIVVEIPASSLISSASGAAAMGVHHVPGGGEASWGLHTGVSHAELHGQPEAERHPQAASGHSGHEHRVDPHGPF